MDFPGGLVVKNPPGNPRDMGPNPGPAGFHMLQHNQAEELQLQSLGQQKPLQREAHAPQAESKPLPAATGESPCTATKTQHRQKWK